MMPDTFIVRAWRAGTTEDEAYEAWADVCSTWMTNKLANVFGNEGEHVAVSDRFEESFVAFTRNCTVGEVQSPLPNPAVILKENGQWFVVMKEELHACFE